MSDYFWILILLLFLKEKKSSWIYMILKEFFKIGVAQHM